MKVHVIEADLHGSLPYVLDQREKLGQEIVSLARRTGESIFFHEFKNDTLGGAPTLMLECSDPFLAELRKLPSYKKDQPAWPGPDLATQRSPKLQGYYLSGGSASRKGPTCKMKPPPGP